MSFCGGGTVFAGVFLESMCAECVRPIIEAPSLRPTSPKMQPRIVSNNGRFPVTIHVGLILTARAWHGSFDFKGRSEQGIYTKASIPRAGLPPSIQWFVLGCRIYWPGRSLVGWGSPLFFR